MYRNSLKTHSFGGVSVWGDHFVNRALLHFRYHSREPSPKGVASSLSHLRFDRRVLSLPRRKLRFLQKLISRIDKFDWTPAVRDD